MGDEHSCTWMFGPRDGVNIPAVKWWFAISRNLLTSDQRRASSKDRPATRCNRTPSFSSPIRKHRLTSS